MVHYLPGRNPLFHGEPPPEWEPPPRWPTRRAVLVTIALVVGIALLMLLTLPEGDGDGSSDMDCPIVSEDCPSVGAGEQSAVVPRDGTEGAVPG